MAFRTEYKIELAAPIGRVFALIEDPTQSKTWRAELVARNMLHESPGGVASTFTETVRHGNHLIEYAGEVTHWSPPRELGVRIGNGRFMAEVIYRLTPIDDSRTKLRYICHTRIHSRIATWLIGWHVKRFTRKMLANRMANLKAAAEKPPATN